MKTEVTFPTPTKNRRERKSHFLSTSGKTVVLEPEKRLEKGVLLALPVAHRKIDRPLAVEKGFEFSGFSYFFLPTPSASTEAEKENSPRLNYP